MNYQGLRKYTAELAQDVINWEESGCNVTEDFHYAIHQVCDSSELVIYYGKAWETVDAVRRCDSQLMGRAEEMREEYGMESNDLDTIMTQLAYSILYIMTTEAVEELSTCKA